MSQPILFLITSVGFCFVAWGIVVAWYVWPHLRGRSRAEAMRPLLVLHSFRFVGLSFLVPGVVSPDLPAAWAGPAAYGDLIAAILALLALAGLKSRSGMPLVWVTNVWGLADFLYAFYEANRGGLTLVSWVPATSLSLSSYHCSSSRTGCCSASSYRETLPAPSRTIGVRHKHSRTWNDARLAEEDQMPDKLTIVLVHGFWGAAAHWSRAIVLFSKLGC